MKDALPESGDCWEPVEMQFIKWTTEGMVKESEKMECQTVAGRDRKLGMA